MMAILLTGNCTVGAGVAGAVAVGVGVGAAGRPAGCCALASAAKAATTNALTGNR